LLFFVFLVELEARESAALQKAAKDRTVKEQQTKNAAKQLEQEVIYVFTVSGLGKYY